MGLFKKEEHKRVVRDESGNFVRFERSGDRIGSRTPVSDALLKQQPSQKKQPGKWKQRLVKVDRAVVNYNRRNYPKGGGGFYSPMESFLGGGSMGGSGSGRKPSKGKTKYVIRGGKAYPVAKKSNKKKSNRGRRNDFDDLFNLRI